MRKPVLILATLFIFNALGFSQDAEKPDSTKPASPWKKGGLTTLTFSQSYFENWVAGGENTLTANGRVNLYANYKKEKWSWDNSLDMAYGQTKQGDLDWRKSDDIFDLNTKFGYKASKAWYISGMFQFKTQFDEGIDYTDTSVTSRFLSPAYINFGIGMDYKPNDELSVYISPLNSKLTYVADDSLTSNYSIEEGENLKYDFGLYIKAKYQKDLTETINLLTKLDLFSDYGDIGVDKIDVNWELILSINVWKALAINISTNVLYDNDIKDDNGDAFWQFKEVAGVGLTYKF